MKYLILLALLSLGCEARVRDYQRERNACWKQEGVAACDCLENQEIHIEFLLSHGDEIERCWRKRRK